MTDTPVPQWKVTAQRQSFRTVDGRPEQTMIVTFATAAGVTDSVEIPVTEYNATNVAAAITAKANTINEVHGLEGPPS